MTTNRQNQLYLLSFWPRQWILRRRMTMPKRSFQTRQPRINHKIRTDLLPACLEGFLTLVAAPTNKHLRQWFRLELNYHQLTGNWPLRVWVFSNLREFREDVTVRYWFELLESVKEADDELGGTPKFFFRYQAASPFKGMIVFWVSPKHGPRGKEKTAAEIAQLRARHGIRNDESPRYSSDNGRFVAFPITASDIPSA